MKAYPVDNFRFRPVYSYVDPRQPIDIEIMCCPFAYNPSENYSSHRIVINYAKVPLSHLYTAENFWKSASDWNSFTVPVIYKDTPKEDEQEYVPGQGSKARTGSRYRTSPRSRAKGVAGYTEAETGISGVRDVSTPKLKAAVSPLAPPDVTEGYAPIFTGPKGKAFRFFTR